MNAIATEAHSRRGYIGGGNIAGILGVSPYRSPLDEYLVITEGDQEITPARRRFFDRRKALEPFAAEAFKLETGLEIVDRNKRYPDAEHPFMAAEIDFEPADNSNGETKSVHPMAAKEWGPTDEGEIPTYVLAQVMHGLGVTGRSHAWVHALVGLDEDRIYRIQRDEDLIVGIRFRLAAFWHDHVIPRIPPPPTTLEDLQRLFSRDSGKSITADAAAVEDAALYKKLKADEKATKAELEAVGLRLKLYMRDATTLVDANGKALLTWKAQTATRFQESDFEREHPELYAQFKRAGEPFRVMRIK
jgi:putative phage-type endonuclease